MGFISKFIAQILINVLALLAIPYLIAGVEVPSDWLRLLEIAFVLGILNFFVKPILKLFLGPLIVLTLGLFSIVLNALILAAVTQVFPDLIIPWGWPLIGATLVISAINFVFHFLIKTKK